MNHLQNPKRLSHHHHRTPFVVHSKMHCCTPHHNGWCCSMVHLDCSNCHVEIHCNKNNNNSLHCCMLDSPLNRRMLLHLHFSQVFLVIVLYVCHHTLSDSSFCDTLVHP